MNLLYVVRVLDVGCTAAATTAGSVYATNKVTMSVNQYPLDLAEGCKIIIDTS